MTLKTWIVALPSAALLALASLPANAADNGISVVDTGGQANCTNVHLTQLPRNTFDCPVGERFNYCFTREGVDVSGLLSGTGRIFVDPTYSDQSKIGWDPDQGVYHVVSRYETDGGNLEMLEVGTFDGKNGNYAGMGTVTGGTGRFEGASGSVVSYGNGKGGGVTTGTVCLN